MYYSMMLFYFQFNHVCFNLQTFCNSFLRCPKKKKKEKWGAAVFWFPARTGVSNFKFQTFGRPT